MDAQTFCPTSSLYVRRMSKRAQTTGVDLVQSHLLSVTSSSRSKHGSAYADQICRGDFSSDSRSRADQSRAIRPKLYPRPRDSSTLRELRDATWRPPPNWSLSTPGKCGTLKYSLEDKNSGTPNARLSCFETLWSFNRIDSLRFWKPKYLSPFEFVEVKEAAKFHVSNKVLRLSQVIDRTIIKGMHRGTLDLEIAFDQLPGYAALLGRSRVALHRRIEERGLRHGWSISITQVMRPGAPSLSVTLTALHS